MNTSTSWMNACGYTTNIWSHSLLQPDHSCTSALLHLVEAEDCCGRKCMDLRVRTLDEVLEVLELRVNGRVESRCTGA